MIDFHNHIIPGVDDGAANLEEACGALAAMWAQGVRTVVATPHLRGGMTRDARELEGFLNRVETAWTALVAEASDRLPELRLERGFEVMLDTPSPDLSNPSVRLAGTEFVLVEFPFMAVPPNGPSVLFDLRMQGWTPVVAHPERYSTFDVAQVAEWRRMGALMQVNCGSLLGKYGSDPRARAWSLVRNGMVDFLSSDFHARGGLHVAACREALEAAGGDVQARLLLEENAARLLENLPPEPVPPLRRRSSILERIFRRA
jgi:protein-tyrosine phosphatase